jgi:hypothetical protein
MMDSENQLVVFVAAAHHFLSMMALVIESAKRKRRAPVGRITYAPIDERDRIRLVYLNSKIWRDDVTCVNMLRLTRASFFRFCELFRNRCLLEDTIHMCVEQQVGMFLHTIGHNVRNRVIATNFGRSSETVSRYFNKVLHAVGELRKDYIRPPSLATPAKIAGNPKWDPYFKVQLYLHIIFQGISHFWGAYMLLYCYNRIVSVLLMVHMYEPQFLRQWRLPSVVGKVTLPKM